jgi:hypothetical protein
MSKVKVLMREVVVPYHPVFKKTPELCDIGLEFPHYFNIEALVEECLAEEGHYTLVRGDHHDFSDGSDCKTASIRPTPQRPGSASYKGEISGVQTASGSTKMGALRCIIYNPHTFDLMYYYLPNSFWMHNIQLHPTSGIGKVVFSWNDASNHIPKFKDFQCGSFKELAQATG